MLSPMGWGEASVSGELQGPAAGGCLPRCTQHEYPGRHTNLPRCAEGSFQVGAPETHRGVSVVITGDAHPFLICTVLRPINVSSSYSYLWGHRSPRMSNGAATFVFLGTNIPRRGVVGISPVVRPFAAERSTGGADFDARMEDPAPMNGQSCCVILGISARRSGRIAVYFWVGFPPVPRPQSWRGGVGRSSGVSAQTTPKRGCRCRRWVGTPPISGRCAGTPAPRRGASRR